VSCSDEGGGEGAGQAPLLPAGPSLLLHSIRGGRYRAGAQVDRPRRERAGAQVGPGERQVKSKSSGGARSCRIQDLQCTVCICSVLAQVRAVARKNGSIRYVKYSIGDKKRDFFKINHRHSVVCYRRTE
jgi:hypothetical protein